MWLTPGFNVMGVLLSIFLCKLFFFKTVVIWSSGCWHRKNSQFRHVSGQYRYVRDIFVCYANLGHFYWYIHTVNISYVISNFLIRKGVSHLNRSRKLMLLFPTILVFFGIIIFIFFSLDRFFYLQKVLLLWNIFSTLSSVGTQYIGMQLGNSILGIQGASIGYWWLYGSQDSFFVLWLVWILLNFKS